MAGEDDKKEPKLISPYTIQHGEHSGQVLISVLLNGENYERWSKLMMNALRSKRKPGFINGTLVRPEEGSDDAERWDMVNSLIIGWIMASIDEKLRASISIPDDVSEMWTSIKTRFSVSDGTRGHQLHDDIRKCKQEGQTVDEYYGKLKMLWDDLADLDKGFSCCCNKTSCASMVKYNKKQDGIRIHQFLMGLDSRKFGTTRSNLLARLPDLNLDQVYSQIVQEERHHKVIKEEELPSTALGLSVSTSKQSLLCTHCGRVGHEKSQCFKIVGYPKWWPDQPAANRGSSSGTGCGKNSTCGRGKGRGSQPTANQTSTTSAGIPSLTPAQWSSLAGFLESKKDTSGEKLSGKPDKLILFGTHSRYDLIIDSGASHHMTGDITLLSDLQSISACPIKLPNGGLTWATRSGILNLGGKMVLRDVLYAPDLHITLISVTQLLDDDIASSVIFTKRFCLIQDQTSKTLIGAGEARDGVYHLTGSVLPQASRIGKMDTRDLWHRRMGHPSSKVLTFLAGFGDFSSGVSRLDKSCDICSRAKQTRVSFSESSNKADDLFNLIHCDVWGPYHTKSTCGSTYFLMIVDDFSRAVWTHLVREKSAVATIIKNFITWVERQFGKQVLTVRTDNGTEFLPLRSYFAEHGISHHTSCVYTPQQNGQVERKHRHILNVARALMFQAHLPIRFWGESTQAACFLINYLRYS